MPELPWILRHGLVVIGGRNFGLPKATVEQLIEDVRQFHCDSALAILLRLNLALTHHRPLDQASLVRVFLPAVADEILSVMRESGTAVVFHEAQVLNLIRLLILHAPTAEGRRCDEIADFNLLARILLQLTDVLGERDGGVEPDRWAWAFSHFTRSELFTHDEHFVPDVMARNYDLFVLIPRLLTARGESR